MDVIERRQRVVPRVGARHVPALARNAYVWVVCAYLVLGNIPRLVRFAGFHDKISVSEYLIYLMAGCVALLHPRMLRSFVTRWFGVIWCALFSFSYGALINGFMVVPALYCVRLLLLLFAADVAGHTLYRKHGRDARAVVSLLSRAFAVVMAIGVVIYVLFPDLTILWDTLDDLGAGFLGDPHRLRFVSTIFDPNFYAAIAAFYLLMYAVNWRYLGKPASAVLLVVCVATVFMTGSRSGIPTALAVLLVIAWQRRAAAVAALVTLRVKRSHLRVAAGLAVFLLALAPVYYRALATTAERLASVGKEASSLARYESFEFGMELIEERPLWGIGYNYLVPLGVEFRGLASLDSSVQVTVICFGLVLSVALAALLALWAARLWRRLSTWSGEDPVLFELMRGYLAYLGIVLAFTCHFNNVLYYPLWLFPVVMVGSYLTLIPARPADLAPDGIREPEAALQQGEE